MNQAARLGLFLVIVGLVILVSNFAISLASSQSVGSLFTLTPTFVLASAIGGAVFVSGFIILAIKGFQWVLRN